MKKAFVCSGGGAKGSFEAGVLKQLAQNGIVPDVMYGTSTGAMNTAGYIFAGPDKLLELWRSLKGFDSVMKMHPWYLLPYYLLFAKGKGVFTLDPIKEKLRAILIGEPGLEGKVCMISLKTSKKVFIRAYPGMTEPELEDFQEAVLASASNPVLNDLISGEFGDGGVRQITPLAQAIRDGATDIYVILADPYVRTAQFQGEIGNCIDVLKRTIGCMIQEMFWQDVNTFLKLNKVADGVNIKKINLTLYAPSEVLMETDDFDPAKIESAIQKGLTAQPVLVEK
jgi:predicted acylesterase/phospholipase RssA